MSGILVAGMGNALRSDDGFGVEVARRLAARDDLPGNVKVIEVGIGGIHLVHELMDGYDVLVIVDAVERGGPPGTMHLLEAEVPDLDTWPEDERRDFFADTHYTTPSRALTLAKALGILPSKTYILGCQAGECGLGLRLSGPVETGVHEAVEQLRRLAAGHAGGTATP